MSHHTDCRALGGLDVTQDHVTATATPQLGLYEIDTNSSTIRFEIRHLFGLLPVRGTFAIRIGMVDVTEPLTDSSVRAEIDAASFHTGNEHRDSDVRLGRFLDADRYRMMTFASERVDGSVLAGTLTVREVSRPVSLTVEESEVWPAGFTVRATTRIDRTEFGMTAQRGIVGRYLDVALEIRCVRV